MNENGSNSRPEISIFMKMKALKNTCATKLHWQLPLMHVHRELLPILFQIIFW